jgi:hypothetical protein
MNNGRRQFATVALIAFCWLGNLAGHAETNSETRAASVLFKQFETVVYTRTDFLASFDNHDGNVVDGEDNLILPFGELFEGFQALGPKTESDLEKIYGAVLVGAKDFGGPEGLGFGSDGLGLVNSRKCYIAIQEGDTQPNIDSDFSKASYESIEGKSVWTWSVPLYEGSPKSVKFYAAQIGDSFFVMTNNRPDFEEAVKSLTSAESSKPTSISVPGWATFSAHNYWAYRLYRRGEVRYQNVAGTADLTLDVIALTFFADVDKREGFIQVLSSDTSMKSIPNIWRGFDQNRFQPQGPGIWQATIPLSKDEAGVDSLSYLFYRFGFGVAL